MGSSRFGTNIELSESEKRQQTGNHLLRGDGLGSCICLQTAYRLFRCNKHYLCIVLAYSRWLILYNRCSILSIQKITIYTCHLSSVCVGRKCLSFYCHLEYKNIINELKIVNSKTKTRKIRKRSLELYIKKTYMFKLKTHTIFHCQKRSIITFVLLNQLLPQVPLSKKRIYFSSCRILHLIQYSLLCQQ